MKYDFSTTPRRNNCGSVKWNQMKQINPDLPDDIIPFSVADMDFLNPPEIIEGLRAYLTTAVLGYTQATDDYLMAVCNWMSKRHDWKIDKDWIIPTSGVVPALYLAVTCFTKPGDGVIIQTPVYYPFYSAISDANRSIAGNSLIYNNGLYSIDFEDFENKAKDPKNKVFILCNPHNPVGRVWTHDELARLGQICCENNVLIVSDDIHFDLIMPGFQHTVIAKISEEIANNTLVCTAPSKSFNLAGLQASNIIIPNKELREQFYKHYDANGNFVLNCMAYEGCKIAYTQCENWLDEAIAVIDSNRQYIEEYLSNNHPYIKVTRMEGTYLLWMDFRELGVDYKELEIKMQNANLFFDEGYVFGDDGIGFERMNLACPRSELEKAMARLTPVIHSIISQKEVFV